MSKTPNRSTTRRRAMALAGVAAFFALAVAKPAAPQSAGAVTITIDDSLGATYGVATILIDDEPQGVLSAGCCMYLQIPAGDHVLTLAWPDHEASVAFETTGDEPVAFHVTSERALIRLED
ncbi:MAG: hypothetical protein AAGF90_00880 [Pseudomonadota bacterium]